MNACRVRMNWKWSRPPDSLCLRQTFSRWRLIKLNKPKLSFTRVSKSYSKKKDAERWWRSCQTKIYLKNLVSKSTLSNPFQRIRSLSNPIWRHKLLHSHSGMSKIWFSKLTSTTLVRKLVCWCLCRRTRKIAPSTYLRCKEMKMVQPTSKRSKKSLWFLMMKAASVLKQRL